MSLISSRMCAILLCMTVIVLIVTVAGCSSAPVTMSTMAGQYVIEYHSDRGDIVGGEVLVLKADGTYTQTFTPKGGAAVRNSGKWELVRGPNSQWVDLHDLLVVVRDGPPGIEFLSHPVRTDFSTSVGEFGWRGEITIDDDKGLRYERVK